MFSKLINKLSTKLHVQISEKSLKVINLKTGYTYEDKPLIVVEKNTRGEDIILAIGQDASLHPNAINPFSHPRVILDNFKMAKLILRHAFVEMTERKVFFSPIVIIQIMKKFDTPLSDIEKIALCELSTSSGARETIIHENMNLDIQTIDYNTLRESSYCCK